MTIELDELERLAKAATAGPWRGDRIDGTVKYDIVAGDYPNGEYTVVCHGDNGNACDGGYGFTSAENEDYALAANPTAILELIAEVRALQEDLQASKLLAHANTEMFKAEKVDGERYRFLKAHWGHRTPILNGLFPKGVVDDAFDAGIDAALAKEKL